MHVLFEVFLKPGASGDGLLTDETLTDTHAQIMTPEDAKAVGIEGIPDDPEGRPRCLIVVAKSDERRINHQLELSAEVTGFRVHEVGL